MKIVYSLFFLCFMLPGTAAEYELKKYDNDPLKTWHYTLKNGLQVFLTENHEKPVFYSEIVVRAGSSSDPQKSTGIAHYLEHMLFKGTDRYGSANFAKEKNHLDKITLLYEKHFDSKDPEKRREIMAQISEQSQLAAQYAIPSEFDRMYQRMGANKVNAHTSHEETVYKVQCPSNSLKKWCLVESERFRNPIFRLFQTEIEAVYEEKNGSLDNKMSALYETFLKQVYKKHPYGQQTTLGSVEHLKSPSIRRMYEFYKTYYVPNNMAIIISGDINPEEDIKVISRYFSTWKKQAMPVQKEWQEAEFDGEEVVEVNFPGEEQLMMAFRIPLAGHKDELALRFMDMILDNSQAGLINVNLNQALKVKRAGCGPSFLNDHATHRFYGSPKKGQKLEDVKKLILEQIEKVKKGEFEEWLLPAILADFKKGQQAGYEQNASRVATLRDLFISKQTLNKLSGDMKDFAKITKADIIRVANKYYRGNYVVAYRRDKEIEKIKMKKPAFKKVKVDLNKESLFSKRVQQTPVSKLKPAYVNFSKDFKKKELSPGLTFYSVENPINNLFTLSINVPIGKAHEPLLPLLSSLFNEGGWSSRSSAEVSTGFYKKAANFSMAAGKNQTTFTLQGLDDSFEDTYKLLHELLLNFETNQQRIKTQAEIILDARQKQKKEPRYLNYALAYFGRYKEKSTYLTDIKDEEMLAAQPKTLKAILNKLLMTEMKVSYTGSRKPEDVMKSIANLGQKSFEKAPAKIQLKTLSYKKPQVNFLDHNSVQTHIRMEFSGDIYEINDEAIYMIFNEYFDGSLGSIVFQEIRETRALAYSAWSRYFPIGQKGQQNLMICGITTQADKTIDAMQVFHDIVYKFKFEENRFQVAKEALITQLETKRVNFRNLLGTVQNWEEVGVTDKDPSESHLKQIRSFKLADLEKFVKEKIYGKKFIISIVGDKKRIDLDKLKAFGDVNEVKVTDLFIE